MYKGNDIRELVQEHHVRFLRLQFTDIFGRFKNIAVPVTELERVLANQVSVEGSVFTGQTENQETVYLHPDGNTFILFPWRPRDGAVARMICNGYRKSGERFDGCTRGVLEEKTSNSDSRESCLSVGAAIDFFLFHVDERGKPLLKPQDCAGLCDLSPLDLGENARRDMVNTLDEMGIEVAFSHHGGAPGQNRIYLKSDNAAAMADKIVTFKFVIGAVAQRHGLYASFIPKPFKEYPGSGMSLYLALMEDRRNVFSGDGDALGLSNTAYGFVAGLLEHAGALTAVCCPSVMSYKRLSSDARRPVLAGLSMETHATMLNTAPSGDEPILECWIPDATCNPYLAISTILDTGMQGISGTAERPAFAGNNLGTGETLPLHLGAALEALKADACVREAMGEYTFKLYLQRKEKEWNDFLEEIHPWEIERYLP
ncbi:MAG: glutamine synthetase family protein [Bacillota bacterium]